MSKEYIIIKGNDTLHLEQLVNLGMNEGGFVPLGGVIVLEDRYAYQAMVKQSDTKD